MSLTALRRSAGMIIVVLLCIFSTAFIAAQETLRAENHTSSLPIEFEPNQGQFGGEALYIARTQTLLLALDKTGLKVSSGGRREERPTSVRFAGADPNVEVVKSDPTGGESNYLLGNASNWHQHIPHFRHVKYKNLYPGVDLVFYGSGPVLEHDFVVAPGARVDSIVLEVPRFETKLAITDDGDLRITGTNQPELILHKPQVYQVEESQRKLVEGGFRLLSSNKIGFSVGEYDSSRPLVIDPALTSSTYLADLSLTVSAVATDATGNTYIAGLTFSDVYPVTSGSFQTGCSSCTAGTPDVFVTKLNPGGTAQIYSTFLGGNSYDQAFGLAVDATGNAVVAGYTESTDFPVKDAITHGNATNGTTYGFVTSLTVDGSALNYSSLLGGTNEQFVSSGTLVTAVALDRQGNAYVAGGTDADAFPVTGLNCCKLAYPDSIVFVTKFLTTGKLSYSSLIGNPEPQNGGGGPIGVSAIAVDRTGSAVVAGQGGTLWPTTPNAYQQQIDGDSPYAAPFVTKLTPDGTALSFSTFLGNGNVNGITLDAGSNVWVTGSPNGPNFPVTAGAYETTPPSTNCCVPFFSKLNSTGTSLLYSSFFYGSAYFGTFSTARSIAIDGAGDIWLAGSTGDPQWPLTRPLQDLPGTALFNSTGFVSRFNNTGKALLFSTYFGGPSAQTQVEGVAIDGQGFAHIAGVANYDLFTTPGTFLPTVTPPPPFYDYTYGFAAVIDPNQNSSALCIAYPQNQGIFFGSVALGTTVLQTITISNCGSASLTISSFQPSISQFTIPDGLNHCKQAVAINSSCTLSINFKPTDVTSYNGTLTMVSNASIPPAVLNFTGSGAVPQIVPDTNAVNFDPQFLNQTSPPAVLFVYNQGSAPLTISLSRTTMIGDFSYRQSGCNQPIYPGSFCLFQLTFTPTMSGSRHGKLSIVSNDPVTPTYPISLAGVGYSSYPVPFITSLNSSTVAVSTTPQTIFLNGGNFFPASVVQINGVAQRSRYLGNSQLEASIDPANLRNMAELSVTVFNPAPAGGQSNSTRLVVYQSIALEASALVFDPVSKLLYAAIPASATSNPNTVVSINPATGVVQHPISVGNDPQKLAVSDDGSYLYVVTKGDHKIQRIALATHKIDRSFLVPVDGTYGQTTVAYLGVVPGSPQLLVTALFRTASPAEDGIALFNDSGLVNWLPDDFQHGYTTVDSFAFAGAPAVVYANPFSVSFFQTFSVDNSGIAPIVTGASSQYENALVVSDGLHLYVGDGTVWDAATQTKIGAIDPPLFFASGIVPDSPRSSVFFLNPYDNGVLSIQSYDQNTLLLNSSLSFPSVYPLDAFGLCRWGTNGFAFQVGDFINTDGSNQLILFKSSI